MVARVLIVNEYHADLRVVSSHLRNSYNELLFPKSMEDALEIAGAHSIDIVLVGLPEKKSRLFVDFFAVLRQLCGVVPIIGIFDKDSSTTHQYIDEDFDDFVHINISEGALTRKTNVLLKLKNIFDDNLLSNIYVKEKRSRKIATIFIEDLGFLHDNLLKSTEIIQLNSWPLNDDMDDVDLFLIGIDDVRANECCVNLRLRKANKYKPIVFIYDSNNKEKARFAAKIDIGCTDGINISADKVIISRRISSLIKYKKMYESFSNKLKKSIYLSAIDATTGVYNRSFFEDFIKNQEKSFFNSAIFIIDIDKFKIINDENGHFFADKMLKFVSNSIKKHVRASDLIARYGGDEFIIFMDNISKKTAEEVGLRIQKTVKQSTFQGIGCTLSVGICCIDASGKLGIHDAISIADKFMYIAKENGGDAVQICV